MTDDIVVTAKRLPRLTARIACELIAHEGIVREAYKDSVGVWTWSVGLAETGGWPVMQYKDNPAPLDVCIGAYIDALQKQYLPDVLKAFAGRTLTEAQTGGALSFHYNTGAIKRASWVKSFLAGDMAEARIEMMEWCHPPEITDRRRAERNLFFDEQWTGKGTSTVYERVRKPSYQIDWRSAKRIDVKSIIEGLLP